MPRASFKSNLQRIPNWFFNLPVEIWTMRFEFVLLEEHGVWVNAPTPHEASKAYALMLVRDDEARDGKPKRDFCPHFNGDYTVYNLPNMRWCWASKTVYYTALPMFFNINLFRCSNFTELRGLLLVFKHKHVHPIWRIQVVWKGSASKTIQSVVDSCYEPERAPSHL